MTPFELVYGIETQLSLPLELAATKLQKFIEDELFQNALEKWICYLMKIEEERERAIDHITTHQAWVKKIFDCEVRPQNFMEDDKVLLWDKRR